MASTTTNRSRSPRASKPAGASAPAAERAVHVQIGAGLVARDNLVSTVKGLATRYGTRASLGQELARYEKRGASARNRLERQVRRTRTSFERQLRQRRGDVERFVSGAQNRIA